AQSRGRCAIAWPAGVRTDARARALGDDRRRADASLRLLHHERAGERARAPRQHALRGRYLHVRRTSHGRRRAGGRRHGHAGERGRAGRGFPVVNGTVLAAVSDGSGGWYLGGQFTAVGAAARSNLAHVLADHSVAAWNPGANNLVRVLVLRSGVLYVGGDFTT